MPKGIYVRTKKNNKKISEGLKKSHKLYPKKWINGGASNPNHIFNKHGKEHPAYKNGSGNGYYYKFVALSIKLFGKNCQLCGASKRVDTHHKDGNSFNNPLDGSNWQRLCKSCHGKLHWKPKRKYKTDEERRLHRIDLDRLKRKEIVKPYLLKKFGTTDVYKTKDICKLTKLSRERIRQLRNENKIKYLKVFGVFYYPKNICNQFFTKLNILGKLYHNWREK